MGDVRTFTSTRVGLALLAEVAGLDLWDFVDQVGGSIDGTRLMSSPADEPGPGHGQAPGHPRMAADVVADQVAAVAGSLSQLAECEDRLALLYAFAAVMQPGAIETAAAPYLAAATESLRPVSHALDRRIRPRLPASCAWSRGRAGLCE